SFSCMVLSRECVMNSFGIIVLVGGRECYFVLAFRAMFVKFIKEQVIVLLKAYPMSIQFSSVFLYRCCGIARYKGYLACFGQFRAVLLQGAEESCSITGPEPIRAKVPNRCLVPPLCRIGCSLAILIIRTVTIYHCYFISQIKRYWCFRFDVQLE